MGHFERYEDTDTSGDQTLPRPPASVMLTVWDTGPVLNSAVPTRPEPAATPGAWEDYETDVSQHVAAVLKYRRERREWVEKHGPVAGLVGIEGGVVSGVINLESPGVEVPGWRPRHEKRYQQA